MKKIISFLFVAFVLSIRATNAQRVKVRLNFPVGISVNAGNRAPFSGAVWVGPEWVWRGSRYECVPGYWAKPRRHNAVWIPGHWKYSRRGYRWVPGHWNY